MNKYICTKCGRFSYSAASLETLYDDQCAYPDCDGHLKEEDLLNRFTARTDGGTAYVKSETGEEGVGHFTTLRRLPELISRLAAYEDTGFSPEEINQMQSDLEEAKPCACCKHQHTDDCVLEEMMYACGEFIQGGKWEWRGVAKEDSRG